MCHQTFECKYKLFASDSDLQTSNNKSRGQIDLQSNILFGIIRYKMTKALAARMMSLPFSL